LIDAWKKKGEMMAAVRRRGELYVMSPGETTKKKEEEMS